MNRIKKRILKRKIANELIEEFELDNLGIDVFLMCSSLSEDLKLYLTN